MMSSCWQVTFRPAAPDNETLENFLEQYFEVTACNYDDDGNDEYVGYKAERSTKRLWSKPHTPQQSICRHTKSLFWKVPIG